MIICIDLSEVCPTSSISPTPSAKHTLPGMLLHRTLLLLIAACCLLFCLHFLTLFVTCNHCGTQHNALLDGFCEQLSRCFYDSALASSPRFNSLPPYWVGTTVLVFLKRRPLSGMQVGVKLAVLLMECYISSKEQPNLDTSMSFDALSTVNSTSGVRKWLLLLHLSTHNFWHQVHCANQSKKSSLVTSVDGVSVASRISHLFSTKLPVVLNSCDSTERDALLSSLHCANQSKKSSLVTCRWRFCCFSDLSIVFYQASSSFKFL